MPDGFRSPTGQSASHGRTSTSVQSMRASPSARRAAREPGSKGKWNRTFADMGLTCTGAR